MVIELIMLVVSLYVIIRLEEKTPTWLLTVALIIIMAVTLHIAFTIEKGIENRHQYNSVNDN